MNTNKIEIRVESKELSIPIDEEIVNESIRLLNIVFNLPEFKEQLLTQKFSCSNRPTLCNGNNFISGEDVYNDFIRIGIITLRLVVKPLVNPWRRFVSKTFGATDINGNEIVTYTWWFSSSSKDIIIEYATHIGHELFHTKYFQYIHNPKYGSRNFDNDKDVTYKIDEIIEKLIRQQID